MNDKGNEEFLNRIVILINIAHLMQKKANIRKQLWYLHKHKTHLPLEDIYLSVLYVHVVSQLIELIVHPIAFLSGLRCCCCLLLNVAILFL